MKQLTPKAISNMKLVTAVILAVMVIVGIIVGGISYMYSMQESVWKQLVTDIVEVTEQGGHAFDTYVSKEQEVVDVLARNLSEYNYEDEDEDSPGGRAQMISLFNTYSKQEGLFALFVYDPVPEGASYVGYGGSFYKALEEQTLDMSYMSAAEVKNEFGDYVKGGVTMPYLNSYTGERTLGYYKRFVTADGRHAIVRKGQISLTLREEFALSFYGGVGFSYVVTGEGDIIVRSSNPNSNRTFDNLFDIITASGNSTQDAKDLQKAMLAENSGAMRLKYRGETYIYTFVPLSGIDEGCLVSVIPNSAIMTHIEETINTSRSIVIVIIVIVIIFAALFVGALLFRRRLAAQRAEIKHREQLFGMLAGTTDEVFIMLSFEELLPEYVSPNAMRVLGIPSDVIMKDIHVLGKYADDQGVGNSIAAVKDMPPNGSAVFERVREHGTTGERRYFRETVYRANIDGLDKVIVVLSDRTSEKQAQLALREAVESAKAANKAKSTFLSNMSHDIRTPMNAIIGFTELIRHNADDKSRVLECTNKIASSGQHLLGLINDVLDMSKIESGKTVLNICDFNLAEFVDELVAMVRPQAKAKMLTFDVAVANIKQERLLGDKLRLNQILLNILSNAIKYTPEGGSVRFDIRELQRTNENYAHLQFVVSDTGIGISEEYSKIIFQPFTRENSTTVSGIQGTGLGMAITKNLVELMGGTIELESKLGEGSTFTVELELRISDEGADKRFWSEFDINRVLIVDDEDDICKNIVETIGKSGPATEYCTNGESAVDRVRAELEQGYKFDLVLLDMRMPGMTGVETARALREMAGEKIRLVLLTSYDWSDFEDEAKSAGINAFMPKPFFVSNLIHTVRAITGKEQQKEEEKKNVLEGRRFLAAEDNELNSEILVELLDMAGAQCEVAENGKLAVEKFEAAEVGYYDAILMDVQMPVMNGYDATRAIRSGKHPEAKTIPIIAMTANAFAEDISNALAAGMNAHIAKPIDMSKLEAELKRLLGDS